ncbi:MAG: DUF362 domain-containing protein [Thermodesulfovibrionales bacterium]|nr:DUF362 domain-containing protein [Thermodesulfovibrionales bacterium]
MNRRDFLRLSTLAGLTITMEGFRGYLSHSDAALNNELAVAQGSSVEKITRAAIDTLGGMKRFVSKGDIVVVKPNMAWDRTPEYAANTNPEVVATVVKMCFEAGAKKVKVFDRTVNDPRRCYVQSGIADAAKAAGAEVLHIDHRRFKDVDTKGAHLKTWPIYVDVLEADKVINIPVAKHHGLAKLTMAMKNWMGVMGGSRGAIHQKLDECIAELAVFINPTLTVLDAVRILTANGPQGGNLADVKKIDTVVVGTDQVAVDSYGATLFGMKGSDLGYVRIAHQMGKGNMDLSKMNIKRLKV